MFVFDTRISSKKRVDIALLGCFGLGHTSTEKVLSKLGYNFSYNNNNKSGIWRIGNSANLQKRKKLNLEVYIPEVIKRYVGKRVGIFLKHLLFLQMKSLRRLKMLRSFRHSLFLPVRGQRTRKNAKTQKKKKKDKKKIQIPNKKKK